MKTIRWLCDHYPAQRRLFILFGYASLILGGAVWFVSFVIPAITLTIFDRYPWEILFGASLPTPFPKNAFLVASWLFTIFGLGIIYLNVRQLRGIRGV
jgi:hypothetical protein